MSWLSSSPGKLSSAALNHSNLQSFLDSVTPIVRGKSLLDQSDVHGKETIDYFTLSDLWEGYSEWSAYGVGSPIVLSNGDRIRQYYCPYLSGIQLFHVKSTPRVSVSTSVSKKLVAEVLEAESSQSDDSESDKSSGLSNNSSKTWDVTSGDSSVDHEVLTQTVDCCANKYFEFYDKCSPYWRVPLLEKVVGFARKHPGIMTFKSTELSAASWMAIAWYPIYHVPYKRTIKDLSACFLTFHTLSSCFQETVEDDEDDKVKGKCNKKAGRVRFALRPFALATHKLQGEVWRNPLTEDEERFHDLHFAAHSWLKQLNVQHHDFNFYALRSNMGMKTAMTLGKGTGMGMGTGTGMGRGMARGVYA